MIKLKNILLEVGEATSKPFKYYDENYGMGSHSYIIEIDKNIKIELEIYRVAEKSKSPQEFEENEWDNIPKKLFDKYLKTNKEIYSYNISFDLNPDSETYVLKHFSKSMKKFAFTEGFLSMTQLFRLMSTIVKIFKEIISSIDKNEIFFFKFSPVKTEEEISINRRKNLYIAYLKKNLPSDWIIEEGEEDYIFFYPKYIMK